MAIIIRRSDCTIEVSDEAELRTVLRVLGQVQLSLPETPTGNAPMERDAPLDVARRAWRAVGTQSTKEYLEVLAEHPEGMDDTQLREALGLKNNSHLAARTTAAVRSFSKAGAEPGTLLVRDKLGGIKNRTYKYRLAEPMIQAVKEEQK